MTWSYWTCPLLKSIKKLRALRFLSGPTPQGLDYTALARVANFSDLLFYKIYEDVYCIKDFLAGRDNTQYLQHEIATLIL